MSGIRRWYEMLEARRRCPGGGSHAAGGLFPSRAFLEKCLTYERRGRVDRVLSRRCDFVAGFMTNLDGHDFGSRPSDTAIGHTGWMGTSWAWSDPDLGITGAVLVNGVRFDDSMWAVLRPRVVDACYDLLDGYTGSGGRAGEGADEQTAARRMRRGPRSRRPLHRYVVDIAAMAAKLGAPIRGANIHVLWIIADEPDPADDDASFLTEFTDGVLTASHAAVRVTPCDVVVEAPAALLERLARAEIHVLELLASGRCQGTIAGLSIFTGIVEGELWCRAVDETDPVLQR